MHLLVHAAVTVALIPGALIFPAVLVWRIARAATGFARPPLPLRSTSGEVLCSVEDWHRHVKAETPVQYALFEALPRTLRRLGRFLSRPFRLRSAREDILFKAFGVFRSWVDANGDLIQIVPEDEYGPFDGLADRAATRKYEIRQLYRWWTVDRPDAEKALEEFDAGDREHLVLASEEDDQIHLARLATIWRDLT